MADSGFLHRYFLSNGSKSLFKWLHYFDIYERHLQRFRGTKPVMLEIGVLDGGSLEMWKSYLGDGCQIVGIDVNESCKQHAAEGIDVLIGSQDDESFIFEIIKKYPRIDIVLDDGSHLPQHMIRTFDLLYKNLSPYGLYMVEDTHTNYWDEYGGGLRKSDSFIEFCKSKVDELNAAHTRGALAPNHVTTSTDSIVFYDSIVVFEKRPQGKRKAIRTEGMEAPV